MTLLLNEHNVQCYCYDIHSVMRMLPYTYTVQSMDIVTNVFIIQWQCYYMYTECNEDVTIYIYSTKYGHCNKCVHYTMTVVLNVYRV